mgnify:CR=1 FL=1
MDIHINIKNKLEGFINNKKIPHLIFYGEPGSGKKYILNEFINKIYKKEDIKKYTMYVNCAHGKGIRFIRDELKFFAKTNLKNKNIFKSIILFNASHLTIDAQSALRRCIEEYSHTTRFFIVIDNKDKLLQPILSRFCIMFIPSPEINGIRTNLFKHKNEIIKVENMIKSDKMKFLKKKVKKMKVKELTELVTILYNKGYSALDILKYIEESCKAVKNIHLYLVFFNKMKKEIRNEKLLMFFIIYFVFLRKELTLENILSM